MSYSRRHKVVERLHKSSRQRDRQAEIETESGKETGRQRYRESQEKRQAGRLTGRSEKTTVKLLLNEGIFIQTMSGGYDSHRTEAPT